MIRGAFKILAFVVVGVLVYNFFYGSTEEKENTKKVVQEFKDVGVAVKDLLQSEKEKLDEGKYDNALDKIGNLFEKVRNGVEKIDPDALSKLNKLDKKRKELEQDLHQKEANDLSDVEKDNLNSEMKQLLKETEQLLKNISENKDAQ